MFCLGLLFWFCFWFRIVSFPSLHTKAVEFFRSQWKGTGLTPGLMSWCAEYLYVSLTWTAGILDWAVLWDVLLFFLFLVFFWAKQFHTNKTTFRPKTGRRQTVFIFAVYSMVESNISTMFGCI